MADASDTSSGGGSEFAKAAKRLPTRMEFARDHLGRVIDFGRTAEDYDRYRPDLPASLFAALEARGWMREGMRALDLGTGTGAMALGLARRGLDVAAIDRAPELIAVLERRAAREGLAVRTRIGVAEDTGEPAASCELVTAAQCWWWFDAPRVLAEARRVLAPGGRMLIVGFSYLPLPGSLAARSEALVLAHNPGWRAANGPGIFPEQPFQLSAHGFRAVESFSYDLEVPFTAESWRGRMRACNGVAASLSREETAAFDAALSAMLAEELSGELSVLHRVFVATGVR